MDEIGRQATLFNKARDKMIIRNNLRVDASTQKGYKTITFHEKYKYFI